MAATALGPEDLALDARRAVVADQALLTLAAMATLWSIGTNLKRLPPEAAARNEIAITIDDGPAAGGHTCRPGPPRPLRCESHLLLRRRAGDTPPRSVHRDRRCAARRGKP